MKTINFLLGISLCLVFLISCQEKEEISLSQTSSLNKEKVAALVERFYTATAEEDIEANVKDYDALTAEELDYFYELRVPRDIAELDKLYQNPSSSLSSSRISVTQYENIKASIAEAAIARKTLNSLAQEKYGIPGNKLNGDQIDELVTLLSNNRSQARINTLFNEGFSNTRTNACTIVDMPKTATTTSTSGNKWYTYYKVTKRGQDDCDWIYAYSGTKTKMHAGNTDASLLLRSFGNKTAMRHTGATDILIGANRLWFFVLYPAKLNVTMR